MPLQVQSQIINEYTPVITVPATAEVITEAALADTAIALGNRIEFVRRLQTTNEKFGFFREDFLNVQAINPAVAPLGSNNAQWFGDTPWVASEIVSPFDVIRIVQSADNIADAQYHNNPGRMRVDSITGPAGVNFSKFSGAAGVGIPAKYVKEMTCIIKPFSVLSGMRCEFGLKSTSAGVAINQANSAALSFLFDPALSGNWQAKSSKTAAASSHIEDTGVAPSTGGSMQKLILRRTQIDIDDPDAYKWQWIQGLADGSEIILVEKVNGVSDYFLPDIDQVCVMRLALEVPDLTVANEYWEVDWISGEFEVLR
jgi:hypothetical protein